MSGHDTLLHDVTSAAFEAATEERVSEECFVSLPLPCRQGLAFFVAAAYVGPPRRIWRPTVCVRVASGSLEPDLAVWTEQGEGLCQAVTEAALQAPNGLVESLAEEACSLAAEIAPWIGREPDAAIREKLDRYDLIYRAIAHPEVRPFYEKASPEYFAWRSSVLQTDPREETGVLPDPRRKLEPSFVLDPAYAAAYCRSIGAPMHVDLSAGTFLMAAESAGLTLGPLSPLNGLTPDVEPSDFTYSDFTHGWPEADSVLQTLCDPALRIDAVCGTPDAVFATTVCANGGTGTPMWLRFTEEEGECSVFAPDSAPWIKEMIASVLAAPPIKRSDQTINSMNEEELAAVFALSDARATSGAESPVSLGSLSEAFEGPSWTAVEHTATREGLRADVVAGIAQLRQRGLVSGPAGDLAVDASLREFLRALGRPESFAVLKSAQIVDGEVVQTSIRFVRTDLRLWVWELAPEGGVSLFNATCDELCDIMNELLGTEGRL